MKSLNWFVGIFAAGLCISFTPNGAWGQEEASAAARLVEALDQLQASPQDAARGVDAELEVRGYFKALSERDPSLVYSSMSDISIRLLRLPTEHRTRHQGVQMVCRRAEERSWLDVSRKHNAALHEAVVRMGRDLAELDAEDQKAFATVHITEDLFEVRHRFSIPDGREVELNAKAHRASVIWVAVTSARTTRNKVLDAFQKMREELSLDGGLQAACTRLRGMALLLDELQRTAHDMVRAIAFDPDRLGSTDAREAFPWQ